MLEALDAEPPEAFVDWFGLERVQGRERDVGMHRRWIDPTAPFAAEVAEPAHGLLVTSATLRDSAREPEEAWQAAEMRTGAQHLAAPAIRAAAPSPFDYPAQTRALVVTDVRRDSAAQVAAACRSLFLAAGGGALGLFTAVARLRAVHGLLAEPLDAAGIPLIAQHVDRMDVATLIDIFRAEPDSCLLGTDAVRDGVDVPGRALRLIAFDRVPWPRPTILHKARRAHFGAGYDDMLTRLRLRQAFGRLVRRRDDRASSCCSTRGCRRASPAPSPRVWRWSASGWRKRAGSSAALWETAGRRRARGAGKAADASWDVMFCHVFHAGRSCAAAVPGIMSPVPPGLPGFPSPGSGHGVSPFRSRFVPSARRRRDPDSRVSRPPAPGPAGGRFASARFARLIARARRRARAGHRAHVSRPLREGHYAPARQQAPSG